MFYLFKMINYNLTFLLKLCLSFLLLACHSQITITDGEMSEGQECFKITTSSATYIYQKEAGGFSNIYDAAGTDWVQFHKTDTAGFPHSSASDFRGLPNLVYKSDDGGCGHPGFDKMTSEQISENQIRSTSKSGEWQWTWTFYDKYAELYIEKADPDHAYWFLYEGPIAGKFSPSTHYWGTDSYGQMAVQPDLVHGSDIYEYWQTVYFGNRGYDKTFFIKQMEPDKYQDMYAYLGNTPNGNTSPDGMVVFGFGRKKGAIPQLTDKQRFIIGFYNHEIKDENGSDAIFSYIDDVIK